MAIAVDLDPAWTTNTGTSNTVSNTFSPQAGSLIIATAVADSGTTSITCTFTNSAGLTVNPIGTIQIGSSGGACHAAWMYTSGAQTNMTVTATWSGTGTTSGKGVKPTTFTGTLTAAAVTSQAASTSATNNLTASYTNGTDQSVGMGVGCDFNQLGLPTSTDNEVGCDIAGAVSGISVYKAAATSGTAQTVNINMDAGGSGTAAWSYKLFEILPAATTSIPYNPQRSVQLRDAGEAFWLQDDRRSAALVAAPANPLDVPLLQPETPRITWTDRRFAPQQRVQLSAPAAADTIPYVGALPAAATHAARLWPLAQWVRESPPGLLDTAQLEVPPAATVPTAVTHLRTSWMRQEPAQADQSAAAADVFDPALAGSKLAYLTPATHTDRREPPQQRPAYADIDIVTIVGTGALGAWWGVDDTAHFLYGNMRRPTVPATAAAVLDPLTVAWGAGGLYWLLYNTAALLTDRREVPQQRERESGPALLATALLENELLGGADLVRRVWTPATHADRREVPPQRPYLSDPSFYPAVPVDADPLLVGGGVGGDTWRRANTGAYYDRRETAAQPRRATLSFDAGPAAPPLALAWGAGGNLWHLYNRAADIVDRVWDPQQPRRLATLEMLAIIVPVNATSADAVSAGRTSAGAVSARRTSTAPVSGRRTSTSTVSDG